MSYVHSGHSALVRTGSVAMMHGMQRGTFCLWKARLRMARYMSMKQPPIVATVYQILATRRRMPSSILLCSLRQRAY